MRRISIALLVLTFLLILPTLSQAIGQITEPINITNALRGSEATAVLNLFNSEETEIFIELEAEGQIAAWAYFYAINDSQFTTPVKEIKAPADSYQDATVVFKIPADAANGVYTGLINAIYTPEQSTTTEETSSTVSQEISRSVSITVSDQEVIKLEASIIPDKYDYKIGEPINMRIIYDNQSNIGLSPKLEIKIIDGSGKTVYNSIYPYPQDLGAVKPQSRTEIPAIIIPTNSLVNTRQQAFLSFYHNDQLILEKNFKFSVGLVSESSGFGPILTGLFSKINISTRNLILVGVALFLVVTAIIALTRYSRLKKQMKFKNKKAAMNNGLKKKNNSNGRNKK